jgi:hypothetical protein
MNDLERLVAIEDLRRLQSRYVRHADLKEWRVLAGLFLPEGTFTPYGVDGKQQVNMCGREEIERRVSASVGAGTALHHLFSYEIDIDSPTRARGVWAMEDWIDRSMLEPQPRAPAGAMQHFKTMHGCGHYHAVYEKLGGDWLITDLKLFRVKLDFTY